MIYYIACTATSAVKIGFTRGEPEVRLKQLQIGSASHLRLVACHEGGADDERLIHAKLAASRRRGEWFDLTDELLAHISFVAFLAAVGCIEEEQPAPHWLQCWLRGLKDQNGFMPEALDALV